MKIRQLLTAFLFLAIAVTACQPKEPEPATISVDPTELTFDISAGTKTVTVKSNYAWEAKWDASWVTVTPSKGEAAPTGVTVTISVLENKDKNQSTAITFYGNGSRLVNASVSIEQEGPNGDGNNPAKAQLVTVQDFISRANTTDYLRLQGVISGFNSTYCSFDLTDASGKIYVYSVDSDSKAKYASVIKNGGTVTIAGKYAYYSAKQQHEVVEAVILEYKDGGSGDTPDYNNAEAKTVAEFLAAANTTTYYKLTGTVSSFNSTYCSFDLTDDSGTIYVYSVTAESKSTYASAIKNGDTVTLAGKYLYYENGQKHEVVEAQILDHKSQGGSSTDVKVVTVNEFLGMPDSDQTTIYQLTGVITNVGDTDGGKFDLKDDTGTVYVYGLYDAEGNKVFTAKSLKAGDTLTVQGPRQNYQGTIEVNKGVYVSHKVGPAQKTMTATHPFTSTDTCAIDNSKKSYAAEVIIEGTTYKAWKFGTSSVAGIATLKLPAGTKSVSFYAVGWNNLVGELEVLNGSDKIASITAAKNSGIANNSPFTITTLSDNDYYTVTFASPLAAETTLTIQTTGSSSSKTYRAVIFGINSTK